MAVVVKAEAAAVRVQEAAATVEEWPVPKGNHTFRRPSRIEAPLPHLLR